MDSATREHIRREIDLRARNEKDVHRKRPALTDCKKPWISPKPLLEALERHAANEGSEHSVYHFVAERTGYDRERVKRMLHQKRISFAVADFIVTSVWVHLWFRDPALHKVYRNAELRWDEPEFRETARRDASRVKSRRHRQMNAREIVGVCTECNAKFPTRLPQKKTCSVKCSGARSVRIARENRQMERASMILEGAFA